MNPHITACKSPNRAHAFSVVEMLVVIAIIGIFSAISVSFLHGYYREGALQVRDRRNAQEISALCMGASAAGADVISVGHMESTIQNLIDGREGTTGTFKGRLFRITALTDEEIAGALNYLEWHDGMPSYVRSDD